MFVKVLAAVGDSAAAEDKYTVPRWINTATIHIIRKSTYGTGYAVFTSGTTNHISKSAGDKLLAQLQYLDLSDTDAAAPSA